LKKFILFVFILVFVIAKDKYFIGIEKQNFGIDPKIDIKVIDSNSTDNNTSLVKALPSFENNNIYGINFGYFFNKNNKVKLAYGQNSAKSSRLQYLSIDYQYRLNDDFEYDLDDFDFCVGNKLLFIKYKQDLKDYSDSNTTQIWNENDIKVNISSLILFLNVDYKINKKQFLSIGYQRSITIDGSDRASGIVTDNNTSAKKSYNIKIEPSKISGFYFSYQYKF